MADHIPFHGTYCRLRVPVWASDREVIRAAHRKLKRSARRSFAARAARHEFLRAMLAHHHNERAFCVRNRL